MPPTQMLLHPHFDTVGDLVIVAPDGDHTVGFRIQSWTLGSSCAKFAFLGKKKLRTECYKVKEPAHDVHAFLLFLVSDCTTLQLDVVQCAAVYRLIRLWGGKGYLFTVLTGYVYANANRLVGALGTRPPRMGITVLLRLAADVRATELWALFIAHLRNGHWRDVADPTTMTAKEISEIGPSAYRALIFLATFGDPTRLWSGIETCTVGRDNAGAFYILRITSTGQIMYSDNSL